MTQFQANVVAMRQSVDMNDTMNPWHVYTAARKSAEYNLSRYLRSQGNMGPMQHILVDENQVVAVEGNEIEVIRLKIFRDGVIQDLTEMDASLAQALSVVKYQTMGLAAIGGTIASIGLMLIAKKFPPLAWLAGCVCGAGWLWDLLVKRRLAKCVIRCCRTDIRRLRRSFELDIVRTQEGDVLNGGCFRLLEKMRDG